MSTTAPVVGAAFVPNKRPAPAAAPTSKSTYSKKFKTESGEEREFVQMTPSNVIVPISAFGDPAFYSKLKFDTVNEGNTSTIRYLTIEGADGKRTRGIHFVMKGIRVTRYTITRWLPEGNIKTHSFKFNAPVTQAVYDAVYHERFDKKRPDRVLGCGGFIKQLINEFIARPAEIFGASHPHTLQLQAYLEADVKALEKLTRDTPKRLKICETDEERAREQGEIDAERVALETHKSSYDYLFPKIRQQTTPPLPKKAEHGGGKWAPTWGLKIKNNSEDPSDLYPIFTVYDTTSGAEDATTVPIYTCDIAPTKAQRDDPKTGARTMADWQTMHDKVVLQYPNPYDVIGECRKDAPETHTCIIKPYSEVTGVATLLGVSLTQGFIDISTRLSQLFITEQPTTFERRRIGEAPISLFDAVKEIEVEAVESGAPDGETSDETAPPVAAAAAPAAAPADADDSGDNIQ